MDYNKGFKHRFLLMRKTRPYAKRSVWHDLKTLISDWGLTPICDLNKTDLMAIFSNGSTIECLGLDDSEKIKSIAGVTAVFLEEATEFSYEDNAQIQLRLRGKIDTYYQIMYAFNPTTKLNWVYKEFYEDPERYGNDALCHLSTYLDNKYLDHKYKLKLEALSKRDYGWHQVYAKGCWGSLENVIYKNWKTTTSFPLEAKNLALGLDFGFQHPSALVLCAFEKEGITVKQLLYQSHLTITDLIDKMKIILPEDRSKQIHRGLPIYCDNARPEAISQLKQAGFNAITVKKGANSVKEGIDLVKSHDLWITKDSDDLISELQSYKWREDKDGNVFEEPLKWKDDAMDALRYCIFMHVLKRVDV